MSTSRIIVVIPDPERRARWLAAVEAAGMAGEGVDGAVAAIGASRRGGTPLRGVLVDPSLPGMGPALLLRALRSIPGLAGLPGLVAGAASAEGDLVAVPDPAALAEALGRLQAAPAGAPAAPPPPPAPVLDRQVVDRVRSYGEEMFQSLVAAYIDELPQRLGQIDRALRSGDSAAAGSIAHALKGSSGSLGLRRLWQACAELDQSCREGGDALPRLAAAQAAAEQAITAMRAELAQRPGKG